MTISEVCFIDLVLITPQSTAVIRTKYELHSFVVSILILSNYYLGRRKKLSCINDSLSADCALSELCFLFNMRSTLTDDALLVSTTSTMLYQ